MKKLDLSDISRVILWKTRYLHWLFLVNPAYFFEFGQKHTWFHGKWFRIINSCHFCKVWTMFMSFCLKRIKGDSTDFEKFVGEFGSSCIFSNWTLCSFHSRTMSSMDNTLSNWQWLAIVSTKAYTPRIHQSFCVSFDKNRRNFDLLGVTIHYKLSLYPFSKLSVYFLPEILD